MDRRSALSAMTGKRKVAAIAAPALNSGITTYTGPWEYAQAAHLLRRAMFGPTHAQIKWAVQQGLQGTLNKLFEPLPMPDPPVNTYFEDDPNVPVGATWINAPYSGVPLDQALSYRDASFKAWIIGQLWQEGISIREKLKLFWHNHIPVAEFSEAKFLYRYVTLLSTHALGNCRELIKEVTIDPTMLFYLNGHQNSASAPNENYARELLELFTIGKGPLVAPGDYTNYTEHDIREFARALTGWRAYGDTISTVTGEFGAEFIPSRHDTGVKVLSHRFDNQTIPNLGNQEYARVVDIIFGKMEVARFICRKLYQWFVYYQITEETEAQVIEPMAQILFSHDFEIVPALRALLASEHFFDPANTGAMIKNPLDLMMSMLKPLGVTHSQPLDQKYDSWYHFWGYSVLMQMEYCSVPEVAGWKAYYLAPQFYRNWITASTLPTRMQFADILVNQGHFPFFANGDVMQVDVLNLVSTLDDSLDPNALIDGLAAILFPKPLKAAQKATLKAILLPGLPDFEWTVEYGQHLDNPGNNALATAIETKLRALLSAMLSMPEFQLC